MSDSAGSPISGSSPTEHKQAVASIFNSAVAAAAVGTAWEIGLFDELLNLKQPVHITDFAKKNNLDEASFRGMIMALAVSHILDHGDDQQKTVVAGELFDEAYRTKSLFHWMMLGSGDTFSRMQYLIRNENRTGELDCRDSAAVAYACRDINLQYWDSAFWTVMDKLPKFNSVADLGCGSGKRLMQILARNPGATGLGIDIAGPSLKVAAAESRDQGFQDRLTFREGDARFLKFQEDFKDIELVTCFMMGHDFWPRDNCVRTLRQLRAAFPSVKRFLLGDATRILMNSEQSAYRVTKDDVPVFTLGFEVAHALMGVTLPTIEEWEGVFSETGWNCASRFLLEPSQSVIFELEPMAL